MLKITESLARAWEVSLLSLAKGVEASAGFMHGGVLEQLSRFRVAEVGAIKARAVDRCLADLPPLPWSCYV